MAVIRQITSTIQDKEAIALNFSRAAVIGKETVVACLSLHAKISLLQPGFGYKALLLWNLFVAGL